MATTQLKPSHDTVGSAIFDDLVEATMLLCESCIRDDGKLPFDECKQLGQTVLGPHGVIVYVHCIEESDESVGSIGAYGGATVTDELENVAVSAVVDAALDKMIEKEIIARDDVLL